MKKFKVLLVSDFHVNVYCWRKEIVDAIVQNGGEVALAVPYGEKLEYFKNIGCKLYDIKLDRYALGISSNIKLICRYNEVLMDYHPDVILLYGSKGMLYTGLLSRIKKIPYITNINGLGTFESKKFPIKNIIFALYKMTVPYSTFVFFQNEYNMKKLISMKIASSEYRLIPGSGVNLSEFNVLDYPKNKEVNFLFCARLTKEKGLFEFLEAAKKMKAENYDCKFTIVGMGDNEIVEEIKKYGEIVDYQGFQMEVRPFLQDAHCVVLPSYYGEGISNSLLESASSARPIITTNLPGCKETVLDNVSGYIISAKNSKMLYEKMKEFVNLSVDQKKKMGMAGRKYIEKCFDRKIVVEAYIDEIMRIIGSR